MAGKSKLLLLGATLVSTVVLIAAASLNVLAGEGNANYLGVLSSTAPSGYMPSPTAYSTGSTVTFQFDVTNLTAVQQSMSLELNVNHITMYKGVDVSDGQPGVSNGAVVDGSFDDHMSTEVQDPSPTFTAFTIAPNATQTVHMSRAMPAGQCGYYQVDVAKAGLTSQKGLVGFEIRVLGCTPTGGTGGVTASPTPAVSPTATPSGGTSGVLGSTATTPPQGAVLAATGMTSPAEVIALILFGFGALVVITALAWRRTESES